MSMAVVSRRVGHLSPTLANSSSQRCPGARGSKVVVKAGSGRRLWVPNGDGKSSKPPGMPGSPNTSPFQQGGGGGSASGSRTISGGGRLVGNSEQGLLEPVVDGASKRNYRPPSGFMDAPPSLLEMPEGAQEEEGGAGSLGGMRKDELFDTLRMQNGYWWELAEYLSELRKRGVDSSDVSMMTGIEPLIQDRWTTAANIRRSVIDLIGEEVMSKFDSSESAVLVHATRYMELKDRVPAIQYASEEEMDMDRMTILVKAYKMYADLEGVKFGFGSGARDRLAYYYFRKFQEETRNQKLRKTYATKALELAETEGAKEICERLYEEGSEVTTAKEMSEKLLKAQISYVRMEKEELGFTPIPHLGDFSRSVPADFARIPSAQTRGDFGVFTPGAGEWIALPAWPAITEALLPFALTVSTWRNLPELNVNQLDDEPTLLILDGDTSEEIKPKTFYLIWEESAMMGIDGNAVKKLACVSGMAILDKAKKLPKPFAKVRLACLPPGTERNLPTAESLE